MTSDPISRYLSLRTAKLSRFERLRTMSQSEMLDVALRVYRLLGWTFLKLSALPALFCLAAIAFCFYFVLPNLFVTSNVSNREKQIGEMLTTLGLGLGIGGMLILIGISLITAYVCQLTSDYMLGTQSNVEQIKRRVRDTFPRIFNLNFRQIVFGSAGLVLSALLLAAAAYLDSNTSSKNLAAPAMFAIACFGIGVSAIFLVYVFTRHALSAQIVVLESVSAKVAAKRSKELLTRQAQGGTGLSTVVTVYFVLFLLGFMLLMGFTTTASIFDLKEQLSGMHFAPGLVTILSEAVSMLPYYLVVWLLVPYWATCMTVLYYERRIRLEGYDIVELAREVWRSEGKVRFQL